MRWKIVMAVVFLFSIFVSSLSAEQSSARVLKLVKTADISSRLSKSNAKLGRPDVVTINDLLYLVYGSREKRSFQLIRLRPDLELRPLDEKPIELFSGNYDSSVDIRVFDSKDYFWYAFSQYKNKTRNEEGKHFLNAAWYAKDPLILKGEKEKLSEGVSTGYPKVLSIKPEAVGKDPEAVDDPTPLYFNNKYYILTRAWSGWIPEFTPNSIHHVRVFDRNLNKADDFTLDLSSVMPGLTLSQNSLVIIDDKPYLIGGFYKKWGDNSHGSQIYAIALSGDLKKAAGRSIPLVTERGSWVFKTTCARYIKPYLFINFQKTLKQQTSQCLAVFDVENDFKMLDEVEISSSSREDIFANHTTFEVVDNKLFVFYPEKGDKIFAKIFEIESGGHRQKTGKGRNHVRK